MGVSPQPVQSSVTSACHYCKEVGHFKNNCPKLAAKGQKKSIRTIGEAVIPEQQHGTPNAEMTQLKDMMEMMHKRMEVLEAENVRLKVSTSQLGF